MTRRAGTPATSYETAIQAVWLLDSANRRSIVEIVVPSSPFTAIDSKITDMHMKKRNQRALARNCRQPGRQRRHPNPVWNLPLLSVWMCWDVVDPSTAVDGGWPFEIVVSSTDADFAMVTNMVF